MRRALGLLVVLGACSSSDGSSVEVAEATSAPSGGDEGPVTAGGIEDETAGEAEGPGGEAMVAESAVGPDRASGDFEWLMLHDVQGLYGGRAIYIRPDGSVIVQKVDVGPREGLRDRRFEAALTPETRARIVELLVQYDPRTMQVPDRPGIPDEARAVLAVRFGDGSLARVAKWDGVAYEPFSALYSHLMALADQIATGRPTREGAYDYDWRPEGVSWRSRE